MPTHNARAYLLLALTGERSRIRWRRGWPTRPVSSKRRSGHELRSHSPFLPTSSSQVSSRVEPFHAAPPAKTNDFNDCSNGIKL